MIWQVVKANHVKVIEQGNQLVDQGNRIKNN